MIFCQFLPVRSHFTCKYSVNKSAYNFTKINLSDIYFSLVCKLCFILSGLKLFAPDELIPDKPLHAYRRALHLS